MLQVLYVGAILGAGLYLGKVFLFWLMAPGWLKRWINNSNFLLGLFDIGLNVGAGYTLGMADGTIAMAACITFGVCTVIYISLKIAKRNTMRKVRSLCAYGL